LTVLLTPLLLAAGLLLVSGAAKLWQPRAAASALRALGLPAAPTAVRLVAALELAVGSWCVVDPRAGAPAAGVVYLAFAAVAATELRRGGIGSCGCLGAVEIPPSRLRLVLVVAFAGVSFAAALFPPAAVVRVVPEHPFGGAIVLLGAVTGTFLCAAAMVLVPPALASYRRTAA
jgi:hypothetical protein